MGGGGKGRAIPIKLIKLEGGGGGVLYKALMAWPFFAASPRILVGPKSGPSSSQLRLAFNSRCFIGNLCIALGFPSVTWTPAYIPFSKFS